MKGKLLAIIDELGIVINENGDFDNMDSIMFVSMIIRIEEEFCITFPEDFFDFTLMNNVQQVEMVLSNLINTAE